MYYCTLYYYITSLPVYLNTVHGQCTTVVLDTSNEVYCILLLMDARYSVVQHYCRGIFLGQAKNKVSLLYGSTKPSTKLSRAIPNKETTGRQTGFDAENQASLQGLKGRSATVTSVRQRPVRETRWHRLITVRGRI